MTGKIPNSRQLLFFLMPDETDKVLNLIVERQCKIFSRYSAGPEPCSIEGQPLDEIVVRGQVFFCPAELVSEIYTRKVKEGAYSLDSTVSPVIELDFSILRKSKELSRGRMYFRGGYDGRESWVQFPSGLYETFKLVSSFMTRSFLTREREYGGYISKGSKLFVAAGGRLVQF